NRRTMQPIWKRPDWGTRLRDLMDQLRHFRFHTIRGRLLVGFGATLGALFASGIMSIYAIQSMYRDMRASVVSATRLSNTLFQGYDATLRFVATAQATLLEDRQEHLAQAESLSTAADSLRRLLLKSSALETEDRRALEQLGALQGRLEVRFAVAR